MAGAIEIKDHNSQVRMSLSGLGEVFVNAINPLDTTIDGSVATYPTTQPGFIGAYGYGISDVPGVVAANNYISIQNPVASGRNIFLTGAFVSYYLVADAAASVTSMRAWRATSVSGGTLATNAEIGKLVTTYSDPVAQLRHGTVTATLGAGAFISPPAIGAAKGSAPSVHQINIPPGSGGFLLAQGEGMVFRTEVGDVDQRWNLGFTWIEV